MKSKNTSDGLAEQLMKLSKLHADGALTDDEFKALKAKLIGSQSTNENAKTTASDTAEQVQAGDAEVENSSFAERVEAAQKQSKEWSERQQVSEKASSALKQSKEWLEEKHVSEKASSALKQAQEWRKIHPKSIIVLSAILVGGLIVYFSLGGGGGEGGGGGGGGPNFDVSVQVNTIGQNILTITNADKGALEIKDIIVNDRDECTYVLPITQNLFGTPCLMFLKGGGDLDNNDRRQMWLHNEVVAVTQTLTKKMTGLDQAIEVGSLKPTKNGKYNLCNRSCPEGSGFEFLGSNTLCKDRSGMLRPAVEPNILCENVSVKKFDKITLNVGDVGNWTVNSACQKIIRVKIVTDKGTSQYSFH
jgi:hypothetical protein